MGNISACKGAGRKAVETVSALTHTHTHTHTRPEGLRDLSYLVSVRPATAKAHQTVGVDGRLYRDAVKGFNGRE